MAKVKVEKKPTGNSAGALARPVKKSFNTWFAPIVFVFGLLIYANTIPNDYNLDDELVTQGHRLTSKGISAIPEIFSSPYYEDKAGYKYEYRPIVLVSFAIEHSFFGENAHVSHAINVLLYAIMCVLLFFVLERTFKEYGKLFPFVITLIFAAHPIHTEVVASIKNRDEMLALIFGLLSWGASLKFATQKKWFFLLLIPLFFYLGILSKSTTITFVLLIPIVLVLLTDAKLATILITTLSLLIPGLLYARLYSITQQIALFFAVVFVVVFIYSLKNQRVIFKRTGEFIREWTRFFSASITSPEERDFPLDFTFLQSKIVFAAFLLFAVGATLLSSAGLYSGSLPITIIPFIFLIGMHVVVRRELQLLLITPIAVLCLAALVSFHISSSIIEAALMSYLMLNILSTNKTFKIVGAVNYLLYVLVSLFILKSFYFLVGLAFLGLMNRRTVLLTILIAVVLVYLFASGIFFTMNGSERLQLSLLSSPFIVSVLAMLWKNKKRLVLRITALSLPVWLLLSFLFNAPAQNNDIPSVIERTYYNINEVKAADLTPIQSVRPIKYIEYPLEAADPFEVKLGTAMVVLGQYLRLAILPYPMSFYYGYSYIKPTSIYSIAAGSVLVIYAILFLTALFLVRKNVIVAFCILFFLIGISVFSNLTLPIPGMLGDRFLLIPSIGLAVLWAWVLFKLGKQNLSIDKLDLNSLTPVFKFSVLGLLVVYSSITIARNTQWKDRLTLFSHDIDVVDSSAQAHNLLGVHLLIASTTEPNTTIKTELQEKAVSHFRKAIEIYPPFLNATYDLGRALELLGRQDEAVVAYRKTLTIDTNFVAPCFNLALYYHNKGDIDNAITLYEKYISKYPYQKEVYANLSFAYFKKGDYQKSIETNKRLLIRQPNTYEPNVNIAKTYMQIGNKDSAFVYFERSFQLNSTDINLVNSLLSISNEKGWVDKQNFYRQQLLRFDKK